MNKTLNIEQTDDAFLLAKLNEDVQQWHHQHYPHNFKPFNHEDVETAFQNMLANEHWHAVMATLDDQPVGYALFFVSKKPENAFQYAKTNLVIDQVHVIKRFRRKGIAKALLKQIEAFAMEYNIAEMELNHWEGNAEARAFFGQQGFVYFNYRMRRRPLTDWWSWLSTFRKTVSFKGWCIKGEHA